MQSAQLKGWIRGRTDEIQMYVHFKACPHWRKKVRQFVAENSDSRRKVRLSPNCRRCLAVFCDSRTFLRQCGQGFSRCSNVSSDGEGKSFHIYMYQ